MLDYIKIIDFYFPNVWIAYKILLTMKVTFIYILIWASQNWSWHNPIFDQQQEMLNGLLTVSIEKKKF